jgi:predicted RNA-binding protein with PUA-like domain
MAYWLLKTEPSTYSYADLERDKKTTWDGVSNNLALKHLRAMQKGDLALIYHSGNEKAIVGIAEIISAPYSDPKQKDDRLVVVDVQARERLRTPVPLASVKARKEFARFELVRMPRLSVMPVSRDMWTALLALGK